jgi:hypothetical protein
MRRAEERIRDYARDFIEDWAIWTESRRSGARMPGS